MKKIPDHFTVDGYEVRFLQSAPVTVCVIRSLKNTNLSRILRFAGIAICNPDDTWSDVIGRRKAIKKALDAIPFMGSISIKAIQRAYWEHYKEVEGSG